MLLVCFYFFPRRSLFVTNRQFHFFSWTKMELLNCYSTRDVSGKHTEKKRSYLSHCAMKSIAVSMKFFFSSDVDSNCGSVNPLWWFFSSVKNLRCVCVAGGKSQNYRGSFIDRQFTDIQCTLSVRFPDRIFYFMQLYEVWTIEL